MKGFNGSTISWEGIYEALDRNDIPEEWGWLDIHEEVTKRGTFSNAGAVAPGTILGSPSLATLFPNKPKSFSDMVGIAAMGAGAAILYSMMKGKQ